ncbi:EF-hand domain-containing protein D1 [Mastacembelus armatus]|uniref:EF-hand domain family, member D1 n=1 Tax=Mastacembelus armatus TaxID=205130 RepID=A0A7N8XG64_9TELE|nr:EF-hand domain-containing protein D1-like [Mastacembelus armatus]
MASEELARKLQSRLAATQDAEPGPVPEQSPVRARPQEPDKSPVRARPQEPEKSPVRAGPQEPDAACGDSSSELSAKLTRRLDINEGNAVSRPTRVFNPYTEFKEFSRKQIKDMEAMFKRYDTGRDGFIDLMELKLMMEKLGAPQTHLGLKNMIKEVDEDFDGKLSFREFLLIFRRAAAGELQEESGLMALARLSEINVSTEGVMGAKDFFEAKMQALSVGSKFEAELREEKEERKRQEVEKKQRQAAFKQLQSTFCS